MQGQNLFYQTAQENEKKKKTPATREVNELVKEISDKDKIGHLSIVDVAFDKVNADEKKANG